MLVHKVWKNTVRKEARKCSSFLFTNKVGQIVVGMKWEVTALFEGSILTFSRRD
jgi:hypothetical protein